MPNFESLFAEVLEEMDIPRPKPRRRDDHVPGKVYLIEALFFHGIIPGCYLRRCKIGLSRNPERRLQEFHDNQPPCDLKILRVIKVRDMEEVETRLHKQFAHCNVKLIKSREWFDLNLWELCRVWTMFSKLEKSFRC